MKNFPKGKSLLDGCRDDLALFMTHMLGVKPYTWQYVVSQKLKAGKTKIVICTSRQVGKSLLLEAIGRWATTFNLGWSIDKNPANVGKVTIVSVISRSDDQAIDLLEKIKKIGKNGDLKMSSYHKKKKSIFGEDYFSRQISKGGNEGRNNMTTLSFVRGLGGSILNSNISSYPPTDAILGTTNTHLFIDEAARVDDKVITENARPTLTAMGIMEILTSTPTVPDGYFYNRLDPDNKQGDNEYERFVFDVNCIREDNPAQYKRIMADIEKDLGDGKRAEVDRNYYCSFTSSNETYFDLDKAKHAFKEDVMPSGHYFDLPVYVGIDVGGKSGSNTVITVSTVPDPITDISRRIFCIRYPINNDISVFDDIEKMILPHFMVKAIVVDQCPASTQMIQFMKLKGWNVIEFSFNRTSKPNYYDRFRRRVSHGKSVSFVDEMLWKEMSNFNMDMKPTGKNTDDMIDSWMLSNYPFLDDTSKFSVHIIKNHDGDDAESLLEIEMNNQRNKHSYQAISQVI
jgi:hypothetical protein